jgi:archaellum component FlaF (FlaF/FlaG flagellin family)
MLEDTIASGSSPILLTGRLVPQATYDFVKRKVKEGKLAGILLVGNELTYPAYDMRERIRRELEQEGTNATLSIMVKFAQALPGAQSGVLSLDTFRVPAYVPKLSVTEIVHNTQSNRAMVGLENTGEGPLYYVLELKVKIDGKDYRTFGSSEPVLVERGESSGVEYPLDLSGVQEGAVTASVLVKYGASKKSLEEFAVSEEKLVSISYQDNSNVSVKSARYDAEKQRLLVTVKNNGDAPAFAFLKLELVDEGGVPTKISAAAIRAIEPYSLLVEEFPLILSEKEVAINRDVSVSVDYGGRRGFLNRHASFTLPLGRQQDAGPQLSGVLLGAGAALIGLLVLYGAYKLMSGRKRK